MISYNEGLVANLRATDFDIPTSARMAAADLIESLQQKSIDDELELSLQRVTIANAARELTSAYEALATANERIADLGEHILETRNEFCNGY